MTTPEDRRLRRLDWPALRATPRQKEVLDLIASGLGDKDIARALGISIHTVRKHIERLYFENQIHNRAAAVAAWLREPLLVVGDDQPDVSIHEPAASPAKPRAPQ